MSLEALDPFAEIRCGGCGIVHFRELPCPPPTPRSFAFLVLHRLHKMSADIATWRHKTLAEARETLAE